MEENDSEVEDVAETGSRVYELSYLLVPTIPEENIPINYGNFKELVMSFGGEIITDEMPKMITLAYTMQKVIANIRNKFNNAYFGWIKFTMDTQKVLEMKKKIDLDTTVIRFLILKTVRENTIASKRFIGRSEIYRKPTLKKNVETEEAVPINKEEIDKEIDALIAV